LPVKVRCASSEHVVSVSSIECNPKVLFPVPLQDNSSPSSPVFSAVNFYVCLHDFKKVYILYSYQKKRKSNEIAQNEAENANPQIEPVVNADTVTVEKASIAQKQRVSKIARSKNA
jgi:hypothetical protein